MRPRSSRQAATPATAQPAAEVTVPYSSVASGAVEASSAPAVWTMSAATATSATTARTRGRR